MFNFRYSHLSVHTEIYVETPTGKFITVHVEDSDTIHGLKVKIQNDEGISVDQQKLIFGGKELKNGDHTLDDYDIPRASLLHLRVHSQKAAKTTMKGILRRLKLLLRC